MPSIECVGEGGGGDLGVSQNKIFGGINLSSLVLEIKLGLKF